MMRLTVVAALATLLSSIAFYPLFVTAGWFWTGLGAIMVVAGAGLLTRRLRLPAFINLLAGLAALHLYLTMLYTSGEAFLGLVPTPASLAQLGTLTSEGFQAANRYSAPVPLVPGISLLTTLGIGLVAAAVDLLAVRMRRAAPAGLPLLAMYTVPAAVYEESLSWLAFAVGAGGFLGLLVADSRERVSGWGRPVFTRRWTDDAPRERPDSSALALTGRRVGVTAVVLAVILPMAVPNLEPKGLFGAGGGGGDGPITRITTPDPLVSLKRELVRTNDALVLTYQTDDTKYPEYLRMYSLDRFDGERWTYTPVRGTKEDRVEDRDLPDPQGLSIAPARAVNTEITIDGRVSGMSFLPLPYPPARVDIEGDWRADPSTLMVYSMRDVADGRAYKVRSLRVEPTTGQLTAAGPPAPQVGEEYLDKPQVPAEIRSLTEKVTENAATDFDKAMALQTWFTEPGNFIYDLEAPSPRNVSALRQFLLIDKKGYCEQFAASMALMARLLGIPSRVAVGYTAGRRGGDGEWIVTTHDMHAWPELYFNGIGWVRFEPTPSGGLGQGSAMLPEYAIPTPADGQGASAQPGPSSAAAPTPGAAGSARPNLRANERDLPGASGSVGPIDDGGPPVPISWLLAGLVLALMLVTPRIGRWIGRYRRWARAAADPVAVAHAAWAEIRADCVDHGLPWLSSESPRATARRLVEQLELTESAVVALSRVARAEERARYARTPGPAQTLRADVGVVHGAILKAAGRRKRWRARLLPASTLATFRRGGMRALEAFDWLDVLDSRTRRRFAIRSRG